ncbi:MAG: aminomethyl-transferring glycine dehydrogenase subunit GcvPA [Candidatus Marinimicrobia bacterium]|nr:aminomethyl-transferring glycine dehydrogenase subunit GcvPA [Candidatus Neomarinimicrobiota bacterium]
MDFVPNTPKCEQEILSALEVDSFEELIKNIPDKFIKNAGNDLPKPLSEPEIDKKLSKLAKQNLNTSDNISFLGGGAYDHFIPATVDFLLQRSEYYTAYTPYQAEVSQGTLQSIYEYQSMLCQLLDMEVANASMYDGATALAEAIIMAVGKVRKSNKVLISPLINPRSLDVLKTYLESRHINYELLPEKNGVTDFSELAEKSKDVAAVAVQSPNFLGIIEDLNGIKDKIANKKALFVVSTDPLSNAILKTPGEYGADIAVAEGQPLGVHQSLGGPYLGVFTAKKKHIRKMPGRIIGKTEDEDGKQGFVMILQTREQHIRRERATSNICTNQGLIALAATIYMALMGKKGIKKVAEMCLSKSHATAKQINNLKGFELVYDQPFFKEFVVKTPVDPQKIIKQGVKKNMFAGIDLGKYRQKWKNHLLIAITEKRSNEDISKFMNFLGAF